ncbi:hypothetical protein C8F01DRAFT_1151467 [Mycena amicta]|nr:hypothetical protein C8F01DRAFT_1151467 [Mycena amicta]
MTRMTSTCKACPGLSVAISPIRAISLPSTSTLHIKFTNRGPMAGALNGRPIYFMRTTVWKRSHFLYLVCNSRRFLSAARANVSKGSRCGLAHLRLFKYVIICARRSLKSGKVDTRASEHGCFSMASEGRPSDARWLVLAGMSSLRSLEDTLNRRGTYDGGEGFVETASPPFVISSRLVRWMRNKGRNVDVAVFGVPCNSRCVNGPTDIS